MKIVTLTTDFGLHDYYVAILKGSMLRENPELQIVDITHNVKPYDIVHGAFVLKNAFPAFPPGSLHLVSVNNDANNHSFIAFQHSGHYFAGPDNGIFSLVFEDFNVEAFRLPFDGDATFPLKEAFAHAVNHLAKRKPFREIGLPAGDIERRIALQPVISASQIRGSIIYIDHYENVVVNIHKSLFEKVRNDRAFALFFKRFEPIRQVSRSYQDVAVGETLCWFNSAGRLEIAINMGKAASMLGLNLDDMVQIDFL